jgi:hypothetical protein
MGEIRNVAYTRVQINECGGMVERYFAEYAFITAVFIIKIYTGKQIFY